jgi:hypothetical protein
MRYFEIRIPEHRNMPLLDVAAGLASRSPFDEFMLYEQGDSWFYAGSSIGRVTVTAREVRAEWPGALTA